MHAHDEWLVWNFDYDPPNLKDDVIKMSNLFPVFANVYEVKVTKLGCQHFLKCECMHYERCGIPCSQFAAYNDKKKKPEKRYKGVAG